MQTSYRKKKKDARVMAKAEKQRYMENKNLVNPTSNL